MDDAIMHPKKRRERFLPNPKLKLREQFHEVAWFQHLLLRMERTYWDWRRRFLVFPRGRDVPVQPPDIAGGPSAPPIAGTAIFEASGGGIG